MHRNLIIHKIVSHSYQWIIFFSGFQCNLLHFVSLQEPFDVTSLPLKYPPNHIQLVLNVKACPHSSTFTFQGKPFFVNLTNINDLLEHADQVNIFHVRFLFLFPWFFFPSNIAYSAYLWPWYRTSSSTLTQALEVSPQDLRALSSLSPLQFWRSFWLISHRLRWDETIDRYKKLE